MRGIIAQYPMIGLRHPYYSAPHNNPEILSLPGVSIQDPTYIDDYLAKAPSVTSNAEPPARGEFFQTSVYHGLLLKLLLRGADDAMALKLIPEDRVKAGEKSPPIFILHGTEDILVPVGMSTNYVDLLLKAGHSKEEILLVTRPGGHGFDETTVLSDDWLQDGLKFVTNYWL